MCVCRSLSLTPTAAAPREARAAVGQWVDQWDLGELSDRLLLILSELVTNAVVHAGTAIEITLSADCRAVRLAVGDRDRCHPVPVHADAGPGSGSFAVGGRGLLITDRLADEWGVDSVPAGKTVWAALAPPETWRHREYCPA